MSSDRFAWKATDVRMRHVVHLFAAIRHHQATRAELASIVGVSQATISPMIATALDAGLVIEDVGRVIRFSPDLPNVYGVSVVSPEKTAIVSVRPDDPSRFRVILTAPPSLNYTFPAQVQEFLAEQHQDLSAPFLPRFAVVSPPSRMTGWVAKFEEQMPGSGGLVQETSVCALAAVESVTRRESILSINRSPNDGWVACSLLRAWYEPPEVIDLRHLLITPGKGPKCSTCGRHGCLQAYIEMDSDEVQALAILEGFTGIIAALKIQTVVLSGFSDRVIDLVDRSLQNRLWSQSLVGTQVTASPFGENTFCVGAAMRAFKWWFVSALV